MMGILTELWRDESGATAIEYALIAGLMAAAVVAAITTFSDSLKDLFSAIAEKMGEAQEDLEGGGGGGGQ